MVPAAPGQALQPATAQPPASGIPTPEEMLAQAAAGVQTPQPPAKDPLEQLREELAAFRLNQAAGVSQLDREVRALKELMAQRNAPVQFDASADPQVKFHSDQIAAIDKEIQDNSTEMSRLAQQGEPLLTEKARLEGQAAYAKQVNDADGEQRALSRVADLDSRYNALYSQFRQLSVENKRLSRDKTEREFNRQQAQTTAEKSHSESVAEQESHAQYEAQQGAQDRAAFDAAIVEQAGRYGLKDQAAFRQLMVDQFVAWAGANPQAARIDLSVFVREKADALARTWGLSPKADFMQQSRAQAAAAIQVMQQPPAQPSPQAQSTSMPSAFDALPLGDQVRAVRDHARRVLQGQR